MLATIQSVDELETAISLMIAGRDLITLGLFAALLVCGLGIVAAIRQDERLAHAARRGQYALFFLTSLCVGLMYLGIFDGYYFVKYVARVTENAETLPFKFSALWASQQGSLLFWCFIMTGFGAVFAFSQRHNRTDRRMPYTLAVLALVEFFFFYIMASPFTADAANMTNPFAMDWWWMIGSVKDDAGEIISWNGAQTLGDVLSTGKMSATTAGWDMLVSFLGTSPSQESIAAFQNTEWAGVTVRELHTIVETDFARLPQGVKESMLLSFSEGGGMNPALHNYWIAIHPPMLYLGFVGFTIPFSYAVGSLLSGEVGEGWLRPIRLWTMASWGFLTIGIALGGLWAYEILGWGGYWAWDPVENASFVPWLTGTAFIHSIIVTERRGMMRVWSFALVIVTYCMTVIGTFLVRSGVINSVHAFGATGDNSWFYAFIGLMLFGSLFLLLWRLPLLKSDRKLESLWSREGSFVINNLGFLSIALTTLLITFWPLITRTFYGEGGEVELGADAYVMINIPLFLMILLLMGIGPALSWRRTSKQQTIRAFVPPLIAAAFVGVANYFWVSGRDLGLVSEEGDSIRTASIFVRQLVQYTLWPICAFTFVCVLMEFGSGARARMRGAKENFVKALISVIMSNRRRYGGYIVHIGLLMIGLGIYYSSFYEVDGTIHANTGGYTVLKDKVSGDKFLVYYDGHERSAGWNSVDAVFGNPERAQMYERMFKHARANADQSADELASDLEAQAGRAVPLMRQAAEWAVSQRDRQVVYEDFYTSLRIFPYEEPAELDTGDYLGAHSATQAAIYGDANASNAVRFAAAYYVRTFVQALNASNEDKLAQLSKRLELLSEAADGDFIQMAGLGHNSIGVSIEPTEVPALKAAIMGRIAGYQDRFEAQVQHGISLGAALPTLHAQLQKDIGEFSDEVFADVFQLGDVSSADLLTARFRIIEDLKAFHAVVESSVVSARNLYVIKLIKDDDADALMKLRPLSLAGLQNLLRVKNEPSIKEFLTAERLALVESEIESILESADSLNPRIRIFYDKRTGVPRTQEPVKDPAIHRTLSKDFYFILQDVDPKGKAFFRFFIKPQMALGLAGLAVVIIGTFMAFLPQMRRRRREVA
ncbi:cytochrome c biogenesis protein CcsA [Planctomycetota bacterium]|nr:cytochrome c biogenesis protein CcsA [Planctomycetota bacterium]